MTGSGLARTGVALANLGSRLERAVGVGDNDGEVPDSSVDQPQSITFDQLLSELNPHLIGGFYGDLVQSSNRRGVHLLDAILWMRPLWIALEQLRASVVWASQMPGLDSDVVSLLHQSADNITAGAESLLNKSGPRDLDESRFLMEVEHLFYDFTADPTALDRWRSLALHRRNQEFGFGNLRRRKEVRDQVPKDHVLLSRNEYRTHSAVVHPRPLREIEVESTDPSVRRSSLFMDLADLVQHSNRLWGAALDYLECISDTLPTDVEVEDPPDTSAVGVAGDMIAESDRRRGVPDAHPYSHVTDDGRPRPGSTD